MTKPSDKQIQLQVEQALQEDIAGGDLTAALVPVNAVSQAYVLARQAAVISGIDWFEEVFRQVDPTVQIDWLLCDGDRVDSDQIVCRIQGASRSLLTAERSALNFLQTLSAVATMAATYVAAVAGTGVRILDTRKTIPGLRLAQKYAVTCGGASNHRVGLYDAILIKENHIEAAGSIAAALQTARQQHANVEIEIEVENLQQLGQALDAGARRVLLDNFSNEALREAVGFNAGRSRLEASGNVNLHTVAGIAATGVDDISVGALTKSVDAVDFSMRFIEEN